MKNSTTKFTFKINRPTGKWASLSSAHMDILLDGINVGASYQNKDVYPNTYNIRFKKIKVDIAEDGNTNCPWKWTTLKQECLSFDEIKKWVNERVGLITTQLNLVKS